MGSRSSFAIKTVRSQDGKTFLFSPPPKIPANLRLRTELASRMQSYAEIIRCAVHRPSLTQLLAQLSEPENASDLVRALRHPLSDAAASRTELCGATTAEVEQALLVESWPELQSTIQSSNAANFSAFLPTLAARLRGDESNCFRKAATKMHADGAGYAWVHPPPECIEGALERLQRACIVSCSNGRPFEAAVLAYTVINWLHPFRDGNGRTARLLFNFFLSRLDLGTGFYLPIKECSWLSARGLEIRLRYTIATADYSNINEYFVNMFGVVAEMYGIIG